MPLPPNHKFPIEKYRLLRETLARDGTFPRTRSASLSRIHRARPRPCLRRSFSLGHARPRRRPPHRLPVVRGARPAHTRLSRFHTRRDKRSARPWLGRHARRRHASRLRRRRLRASASSTTSPSPSAPCSAITARPRRSHRSRRSPGRRPPKSLPRPERPHALTVHCKSNFPAAQAAEPYRFGIGFRSR